MRWRGRCGLDRALEVVILGDGARWIRRLVEEHFPQATHIVDLSHAREHLWNVANAVYGPATPQGAAWAKQAELCGSRFSIDPTTRSGINLSKFWWLDGLQLFHTPERPS
jgi:hypothetical protein